MAVESSAAAVREEADAAADGVDVESIGREERRRIMKLWRS